MRAFIFKSVALAVAIAAVLLPTRTSAQVFVQSANGVNFTANASTLSKAFLSNNIAGDTIVVAVSGGAAISSITDTQGNLYSLAVKSAGATDFIYYSKNVKAGPNNVTATFTAPTMGLMYIHEYAGLNTTAPLDQTSVQSSSTGTAVSSGPVTTTQANELIFAYASVARAATAGTAGFAVRETVGGNMSEDMTVSATGTYTATFTEAPSGAWTGMIATFKAAGGSGNPTASYVQSTNAVNFSTNSTTLSKAFLSNNIAGDTIVVAVSGGAAISSITDTQGNLYSLAVKSAGATDFIYYSKNVKAGPNNVTATFTAPTMGLMYIHEYAGLDLAAPLGQTSVLSGSSTAVSSGPVTTTQANELIFGYASVARAATAGTAGFAVRETAGGNMSEDMAVSATGTYTATFTEAPSGAWTGMIATFKAATGGGTLLPPSGTITSPTTNLTIMVGDQVNFTATGTDPQGQSLSYSWNFGSGSGIANSNQQNPGLLQFNYPGTFTVTMTVTDTSGLSDPNPPTRTITVQSTAFTTLIPQSVFSLEYVDSQELSFNNSGAGVNAFDGNSTTLWHTQWVTASPPLPHEIQINLNGMYNLNGFHYLPNQSSNHGWIGQFEFYVSKDGTNWGTPVATGTFPASAAEQDVAFPATIGHYVRFRDIANVYSWQPWTSVAELNLTRFCPILPSVMLSSPWSEYLQSSSTLVAQAQVCLNPATQGNWGVQFVLDGTQSINTYTAPFQATFTKLAKAEHTVDAYVIDNLGNRVVGTATHDHASPVGVGDYYVTMGDSITYGIGDNYTADNTSNDGRNIGGGYEPVLNNLLTTSKGYPQTVINEGVPGTLSIDGVNQIPWLLPKHPQATMYLIMYGMNDAAPWMPVPSGQGLNPGDSGYTGTYKDHMQQIITAINNAGKRPALAKVNVALADCADNVPADPGYCPPYPNLNTGGRNVLIQQYNQVMDELRAVASNNITVVPPDFYTYFYSNYSGQYWDNIHPNGIGYQSMGNLWYQALR